MREIKDKKKTKKNGGDSDGEEIPEFFSREDGVLRPSDLGEVKSDFPRHEQIGLWDHAEKPPDNLSYWASKLKKPKGFRGAEPGVAVLAAAHSQPAPSAHSTTSDAVSTDKPNRKRKANEGDHSRSHGAEDDGDDMFSNMERKPRIIPGGLRGMMMGNTTGHGTALLEARSLSAL